MTERKTDSSVDTVSQSSQQTGSAKGAGTKLFIELAPLVLFFAAYALYGLKPATAVLMVATVASLIAARIWMGHVTPMLLVTTAIVWLFGSLTFLLDDPSFIKMKPTAVNVFFAGALAIGLAMGRQPLKLVLGEAFRLTTEGWTKLTYRWMAFFIVLAIMNEFIWRTLSESTWVNFKVFGILPLTILFTISQVGLIKRYELKTGE
jgi:intracellular septation protein